MNALRPRSPAAAPRPHDVSPQPRTLEGAAGGSSRRHSVGDRLRDRGGRVPSERGVAVQGGSVSEPVLGVGVRRRSEGEIAIPGADNVEASRRDHESQVTVTTG
jgi:hypothetical protein